MAMVVRVKPEYNGKIIVQSSNSLNGTTLSNLLAQETLLSIYQNEDELRDFLYTEFSTVSGSYYPSTIDPALIHAYDSAEITHNPARLDYPANTTGKHLNETKAVVDTLTKGFVRPVARPSVVLDFANAKMIDPQYAFSRNSVGTYIDKNGLMKVVQPNQPRFGHDPGTLECTGLLVEGSRTNLLLYSSDISNSYWSKGPNTTHVGVTTLLGYTANAFAHGTGSSYIDRAVSVVGNKTYTYSYYSSIATTNSCPITKAGVFSRNVNNYVVTLVATGVYKHELIFTTTSDENQIFLRLGTTDVAGTVTLGMAQLEEGSFATSYIPTVTSAVTRQPDLLNISSTAFFKNLGVVKEGAIVSNLTYKGDAESTLCELRGADTAGWNVVRVVVHNNYFRTDVITGGTTFATIASGAANANVENRICIGFGTNISKMHLNSLSIGSDNTVEMPTNIDSLKIMSAGVMNIKQISIFKKVLTDTEAIAITTPQQNKYPSMLDMSGMAFVTPEAILRRTGRQEFSIDGTGASITRNIRRPYDFNFEIVDSDGVTITSQPAIIVSANTNNNLVFTAPLGKTITYAITPIYEY